MYSVLNKLSEFMYLYISKNIALYHSHKKRKTFPMTMFIHFRLKKILFAFNLVSFLFSSFLIPTDFIKKLNYDTQFFPELYFRNTCKMFLKQKPADLVAFTE